MTRYSGNAEHRHGRSPRAARVCCGWRGVRADRRCGGRVHPASRPTLEHWV